MSRIIKLITDSMAKKKAEVVVEETPEVVVEEVATEVEVRDEAFYAKHTGAQDNVIYG